MSVKTPLKLVSAIALSALIGASVGPAGAQAVGAVPGTSVPGNPALGSSPAQPAQYPGALGATHPAVLYPTHEVEIMSVRLVIVPHCAMTDGFDEIIVRCSHEIPYVADVETGADLGHVVAVAPANVLARSTEFVDATGIRVSIDY